MNVGEDKGKIVSDLIAEVKPQVMVELGGYVGYSALRFGEAVRKAGGQRYFSLERNPEFAAVIMSLVDLAGLSNVVKVVVGASGDSIKRLHAEGQLKRIDLVFLDHYKPAYTSDLKLCEHLGLVRPGTVLAADNVIKPGNPPYLEYVRSSVQQKRKARSDGHSNGVKDSGIDKRWLAQYKEREGEETLGEIQGNPNLVYESKLVHSFEPTGVPVSRLQRSSSVSVHPLISPVGRCRDNEMCRGRQAIRLAPRGIQFHGLRRADIPGLKRVTRKKHWIGKKVQTKCELYRASKQYEHCRSLQSKVVRSSQVEMSQYSDRSFFCMGSSSVRDLATFQYLLSHFIRNIVYAISVDFADMWRGPKTMK